VNRAGVKPGIQAWEEGYEKAVSEYLRIDRWPGTVNDHARWLVHINRHYRQDENQPATFQNQVHSLYHSIRANWKDFKVPRVEFTLEPPEVLSAIVPREELTVLLQQARRFSKATNLSTAYFYTDEGRLWLEITNFRGSTGCADLWDGCVSVKARLLLGFSDVLPERETCIVLYENGWLSIGGLELGVAKWQPKPESGRMRPNDPTKKPKSFERRR
jgi:hypothetical protein